MIPYAANAKVLEETEDGDDKIPANLKEIKLTKWYDKVLLHRPSKVIVALLIASIVVPILLYNFVFIKTFEFRPSDGFSTGSCLLTREARLPCGFENVTQSQCHPQCCFDLSNNNCFHRFPSRFSYITNSDWTEATVLKPRIHTEPFNFQPAIQNLRLSINEISRTHLSILLYNSEEMAEEIAGRLDEKDYIYTVSSPELNIDVHAEQGLIFTTNNGPLIAASDIWEFSFRLTNETMFGFGEIPLERGTVKVLYSNENSYPSIPLIFASYNGSYHGLLIDVESPSEVRITMDNVVVIRSITRTSLKVHLFVGPDPKDIMRDVITHLGFQNNLQYWMLGAHICSSFQDLSPNDEYANFKEYINKATQENILFESHCGASLLLMNDKDIMENINQSYTELKKINKRFIPHLPPYIKLGTNTSDFLMDYENFMMKNPKNSGIYIGEVNGISVVYPDYQFDTKELLARVLNSEFDGLVLVNNWPLDESVKDESSYSMLPYTSENILKAFNKTIPWNTHQQDNKLHMYTHNKYGNNFYEAIKTAYPNTHVSTSNQWMNSRAIIHRQNINTSWANLKKVFVESALAGISGHWLYSTPICGDTENFDKDLHMKLCGKWYSASTFIPLTSIQTTKDPLSFDGMDKQFILSSMRTKLSLLSYFFTVLQSGPLIRPMFYQYPDYRSLQFSSTQFHVGDALLVVPDLLPNQGQVIIRMPPGSWYELWSGLPINSTEGDLITMASSEADLLALIRGGNIIPLQKDAKSSAEATRRQSSYSLIIALDCEFNNTEVSYYSTGELFITENMTISFLSNNTTLTITSNGSDFDSICNATEAISARLIEELKVYGLDEERNNFDHHKKIVTSIDMCDLQTGDISFVF